MTLPYEGTCPPGSGDAFRVNQPENAAVAIVADATGDESKGLTVNASGYEGVALEVTTCGSANYAVMGIATGVRGSSENHGGYFHAAGDYGVVCMATPLKAPARISGSMDRQCPVKDTAATSWVEVTSETNSASALPLPPRCWTWPVPSRRPASNSQPLLPRDTS